MSLKYEPASVPLHISVKYLAKEVDLHSGLLPAGRLAPEEGEEDRNCEEEVELAE